MAMRACDYYVFEINYRTTFAERVSTYGGQDSELTGRKITESRKYFVVAPNKDFARVAFDRYHSKDEFVSIAETGRLDDLVYLQ
jgi:hypothetical protein